MRVIRQLVRTRMGVAAIAIGAVTLTGAGAATVHRLAITSGTGSLGADAFVQTTSSGGALQGEVATSPNTNLTIPFGVLGDYDPASGAQFGAGVIGVSATGYGVGAEAFGSNPAMVAFAASTGGGLEAVEQASAGEALLALNSSSSSNTFAADIENMSLSGKTGAYIYSRTGTALLATTPGIGGVAYIAEPTGEAAALIGYSGNATHPALTVSQGAMNTDLIGTYAAGHQESFIVQANTLDRSGGSLANGSDVQVSGDLYIYGHIFQDCNAFPAVSGTACYEVAQGTISNAQPMTSGSDVGGYTPRQSVRTVEDIGTGKTSSGATYVRIDPTFASTVSTRTPYVVFLTPQGDSRGLYVSNQTPNGFEVHENQSGRSSIGFAYRIVGSPANDNAPRLPHLAAPHKYGATGSRSPYADLHKIAPPAHAVSPLFEMRPSR